MKIIHINYSGSKGGAAIAARRINHALNEYDNEIESTVWCAREPFPDTSKCIKNRFFQKLDSVKAILLSKLIGRSDYSINIFPSRLIAQLNASDADIVHFHWINGEMVSISQLAKIKKPLVWTFHDMWPFCGGEHYSADERYIGRYARDKGTLKASSHKPLFDLDRWVFKRKQKYWKKLNMQIVCPSHWLAECSMRSHLLGKQSTAVIPNCVDLNVFHPMGRKEELRRGYGLPEDKKIILFGAVDPRDIRKGGDLLIQALKNLSHKELYTLAIFGKASDRLEETGMQVHWLGAVSDQRVMAEIYNCADMMCIPSRQDNLPNTGVEAQACGLPIVAFEIGGLPDIVGHLNTGYLAKPFDSHDFLHGIKWVFSQSEGGVDLAGNSRKHAETTYDGLRVAEQYKSVYLKVARGK